MAIAFNAAMSAMGSSVSSVTTPSWAISGSNRCMVGALMWRDTAASNYNFSSMRWGGSGGTSFTQFGTTFVNSPDTIALATARLIAPTVTTTTLYGAVTSLVTSLCVGAANYTGVHQTTPLGTPTDASSFDIGYLSINVTIASNEWALAWLCTDGSMITPSGSQNQRWEVEGFSSGDDRTGLGSVALSWEVAGASPWCIARAVALKPAGRVLTANSGSYLVTGQNAPLRFGRKVQANNGSYLVTGTNASLRLTRLLSATSGVYTISGQMANLSRGYRLNADAGIYTTRGRTARLVYSAIYVLRVLRRRPPE